MTSWTEITDAIGAALGGNRAEGQQRLLVCWEGTVPGEHAHRCILAHYLADTETDLGAEIAWDEAALAEYAGVRDEDLVPLGIPSARGFAPSLHLNLGDGYLRRGEPGPAHRHLVLGLAATDALDTDGYGAMIRAGLANLGLRIDAARNDADAGIDAEPLGTDADTGTDTEPLADTDADTGTDTEPRPDTDADTGTGIETHAAARPDRHGARHVTPAGVEPAQRIRERIRTAARTVKTTTMATSTTMT